MDEIKPNFLLKFSDDEAYYHIKSYVITLIGTSINENCSNSCICTVFLLNRENIQVSLIKNGKSNAMIGLFLNYWQIGKNKTNSAN